MEEQDICAIMEHWKGEMLIGVKLAQEMASMPNAQRKRLVQEGKQVPENPIDDIIEESKNSAKVIQIVATVTQDTH